MAILKQDQQRRKAFVDHHRGRNEKNWHRQSRTRVSNTHGKDGRKSLLPLDRAELDHRRQKWHIYTRDPGRRSFVSEIEEILMETIRNAHTPKPI